jgi:hypothetical protein
VKSSKRNLKEQKEKRRLNFMKEPIEKYAEFRSRIRKRELQDLINIGKRLLLPQHVISTSQTIFQKYLYMNTKCYDGLILSSMCLILSCKLNDCHRKLSDVVEGSQRYFFSGEVETPKEAEDEKMKGSKEANLLSCVYKEVMNVELRFCIQTGFLFQYPDPYRYLQKKCVELEISRETSRVSWIFLNDSFYLPISLFFPMKDIVLGCIYLGLKVREVGQVLVGSPKISNSAVDGCESKKLETKEIVYVANEILNIYEGKN